MRLERLVEKNYILKMQDMGLSEEYIQKRIKKRLLQTFLIFLLFLVTALFVKGAFFYVLLVIAPFIVFKLDANQVGQAHAKFKFRRELQASKFMQLIAPILYEEDGNVTLYAVLSRLIVRLDDSFQNSLFQFMNEMRANPNDITPFIKFAERTSSDDKFKNFMISLFDYQNSSTDVSVIKELSDIANESMLNKVTDIVNLKNKSVASSTNILAASFSIYLIPFMLFLIIHIISSSEFF